MRKEIILISAGLLLAACASRQRADAYGNFEAVETIVSAETNGRIIDFPISEGQILQAGQYAAAVDSILPVLQKQELSARERSLRARVHAADAQTGLVRQQLQNLLVDLKRVQNMVKDEAATQKQLDDLNGNRKVLQKQLEAAEAQRTAAASELNALEANLALLNEQLDRCRIANPVAGTVLEKYSEVHEMTAAGRPLYKIAGLRSMILRVYVSGGQLSEVQIGQACKVRIDRGQADIEIPGTVTWISDTAEFTPKMIQTKEERVNLVYAVKITVENPDGRIKIGMPGEVIF